MGEYYNLNGERKWVNTTLNDVIHEFNHFATDHLSIAQFECKPIAEKNPNDYKYPLMYTEIISCNLATSETQLIVNIYMLDKLLPDNTNYQDVLSDNLKTMNDFYSIYRENDSSYGFYLNDDATAEPIIFDTEDIVGGWRMPVTIQIKNSAAESNVPI